MRKSLVFWESSLTFFAVLGFWYVHFYTFWNSSNIFCFGMGTAFRTPAVLQMYDLYCISAIMG